MTWGPWRSSPCLSSADWRLRLRPGWFRIEIAPVQKQLWTDATGCWWLPWRNAIWRKWIQYNALYIASIKGRMKMQTRHCWLKTLQCAKAWQSGTNCRKWPHGRKSSLVKWQNFLLTPAGRFKGRTNPYWLLTDYLSACWRGRDLGYKSFSGSWQWYEGGVHDPNTVRQGEKSWLKVGRLTLCQPPRQCELRPTSKKRKKIKPLKTAIARASVVGNSVTSPLSADGLSAHEATRWK